MPRRTKTPAELTKKRKRSAYQTASAGKSLTQSPSPNLLPSTAARKNRITGGMVQMRLKMRRKTTGKRRS